MDSTTAIAWHVTLRLDRDFDRVIAPSLGQLRRTARVFLHLGRRRRLLAFGVADTHMHALVACTRREAGRFVHDLEVSLRHHLGLPVPFAPARIRPVETWRHLHNALPYVFGQDDRHGLGRDPFREGTNLGDLLGARTAGAWTVETFTELLPRVRRGDLLRYLPFGPSLATPAPPEALELLPDAAAALALTPDLSGRTPVVVAVRQAAVHVAAPVLGPTHAGALLGISRASVHRHRAQPAPPALLRALELQLRMRAAARAAPGHGLG